MRKNIGKIDRTIRIIAGTALIATGFIFQTWWGAFGIVPLLTAFVRWCPAYSIFGVDTCGKCKDGVDGASCALRANASEM